MNVLSFGVAHLFFRCQSISFEVHNNLVAPEECDKVRPREAAPDPVIM